jgi:hypothetical protein
MARFEYITVLAAVLIAAALMMQWVAQDISGMMHASAVRIAQRGVQ